MAPSVKVSSRLNKEIHIFFYYIVTLAPPGCTQYFQQSDGMFTSLNWGSPQDRVNCPVNRWRYKSCFNGTCILRFLQLYATDFHMVPGNGTDTTGLLLNNQCSGNFIKFKDEEYLVSTENQKRAWPFTSGNQFCYTGDAIGEESDGVRILTRRYNGNVDLIKVKTNIVDFESMYRLLYNKEECNDYTTPRYTTPAYGTTDGSANTGTASETISTGTPETASTGQNTGSTGK